MEKTCNNCVFFLVPDGGIGYCEWKRVRTSPDIKGCEAYRQASWSNGNDKVRSDTNG